MNDDDFLSSASTAGVRTSPVTRSGSASSAAWGFARARKKGPRRARGQGEGTTLHHRRLFLVSLEANEPWPKPDDTNQMVLVLSEDGAVEL